MSSSLLTKRLRQLERAGSVERRSRADGKGSEYHLTPAGEELGPVVAQMGTWGERWLRRPIFEETPDTGLLMWWMRGTVQTDALPTGRTVIHFHFSGAPEKLRYFWLVLPAGFYDPHYQPGAYLEAHAHHMERWHEDHAGS